MKKIFIMVLFLIAPFFVSAMDDEQMLERKMRQIENKIDELEVDSENKTEKYALEVKFFHKYKSEFRLKYKNNIISYLLCTKRIKKTKGKQISTTYLDGITKSDGADKNSILELVKKSVKYLQKEENKEIDYAALEKEDSDKVTEFLDEDGWVDLKNPEEEICDEVGKLELN